MGRTTPLPRTTATGAFGARGDFSFRLPGLRPWALFGLAAAVLLTGCGGGSPAGDKTHSAMATASQSPLAPLPSVPTPKPASPQGPAENLPVPVAPAGMNELSAEGLTLFAQHWVDVLNYSMEMRDHTLLMSVSALDCGICASFSDEFKSMREEGTWVVGGRMKATIAGALMAPSEGEVYKAIIRASQDSWTPYFPNGTQGEVDPGDPDPELVALEAQFIDGHWLMKDSYSVEHLAQK